MSKPIQRIVVATDFAAPSLLAVSAAGQLAVKLGATLRVVHVYDPFPSGMVALTPAPMWPSGDLTADLQRNATAELAKLAAGVLAEVPHESAALNHASTSVAICDHASTCEADLVVIGTHARRGLERLMLGSVAEQVVRHAHCAVLVARKGAAEPAFPSHILVGTDFSPASEAAVELSAALASKLGARVTLVNAQGRSKWRYAADKIGADKARELESNLRASLDGVHGERFPPPLSTAVVIDDRVPDGIVHHAEQARADLIVVATHGRTGLARLLIGSIAERVTRHAHCSVLVARSGGDSFLTNLVGP